MHPGWVSQVHSQMQSSSTSLNGENWASRRTPVSVHHNPNPTVTTEPKHRPAYRTAAAYRTNTNQIDSISSSNSVETVETDGSDDGDGESYFYILLHSSKYLYLSYIQTHTHSLGILSLHVELHTSTITSESYRKQNFFSQTKPFVNVN